MCLGHVLREDFAVSPLTHNISVVKLFNFSWVTGQHFDWQLYILRSGDEDLRLNLDGALVLVDLESSRRSKRMSQAAPKPSSCVTIL